MKKNLAFCLAVLMFILSACGQIVPKPQEPPTADIVQPTPTPQSTPAPTPTPTPEPTPAATPEPTPESTPEPTPEPIIDAAWWHENLPVMDGSTSLIPLEAGIRSALLEISMEEAEKQVVHTTTYGSFYNLIDTKSVDLIFSVSLSEEQMKQAADADVELEQVPVAREGFVFVVNKDNPVDSLTQEQLRGIYSGEITNWSEVGGPDLPIIAYQRNNTSGSQNYMVDFMGDTPLMDAPSELRPSSMSLIIEVISANDYAEQSIGYSVYSYAADMYTGINNTKFIAVDGVYPTKETMASGEYPLLSKNYAIFRSDEPEGSPVRRLCDWLISEEGQTAIAEAGYVPIIDIDYDYTPATPPEPYSAVGSGPEDWDVSLFYTQAAAANHESMVWQDISLPINVALPEDLIISNSVKILGEFATDIEYTLSCLTDKTLEAEINTWIAEAVDKADANSGDMLAFLEKRNNGQDFGRYYQHYVQLNNREVYFPTAVVYALARNGYIWAVVTQPYIYAGGETVFYYSTYCQIWDMLTGETVSIEELFRSGFDIDEYLNGIMLNSQNSPDSFNVQLNMKQDFLYLTTYGWTLTPDKIYIDVDNPYYLDGVSFTLGGENTFRTEVYRDMSGMFDETVLCSTFVNEMNYPHCYTMVNDDFFSVDLLDESKGNSEVRAKINADVLQRAEAITLEAVQQFLSKNSDDELASDPERIRDYVAYHYGWSLFEYGDRLAVFSSPELFLYYEDGNGIGWADSAVCLLYDLQTGELIDWLDLLVDDWLSLADGYIYGGKFNGDISTLPPISDFKIWSNYYNAATPINLYFRDNAANVTYHFMLPINALKWYSELS